MKATEPSTSLLGRLLAGSATSFNLVADLQRNLSLILGSLPVLLEHDDTPVLGGSILSFGSYPVNYHGDRQELARRLEDAIASFEPRLREVTVKIYPDQASGVYLRIGISGVARVHEQWTDVFFGANLQRNGTWIEVTESELG
jgi:predicted component of type VI protein secretion system